MHKGYLGPAGAAYEHEMALKRRDEAARKKAKKFWVKWMDGKTQTIKGISLVDALDKAGYDPLATFLIDTYSEL